MILRNGDAVMVAIVLAVWIGEVCYQLHFSVARYASSLRLPTFKVAGRTAMVPAIVKYLG